MRTFKGPKPTPLQGAKILGKYERIAVGLVRKAMSQKYFDGSQLVDDISDAGINDGDAGDLVNYMVHARLLYRLLHAVDQVTKKEPRVKAAIMQEFDEQRLGMGR